MPVTVTWPDISLRLLCAITAGILIGLNRTEHGRAAGLRTNALVSLAACVSMIQVNLLLTLSGKSANSFVVLDIMRLPLGILSGMGFIGAGAIVRRGDLVSGVTTAAAMWFVTVIGLCFGGGQILLGLAGTAVGLAVLAALKTIEDRMMRDRQSILLIVTDLDGPGEGEVRQQLKTAGFRLASMGYSTTGESRTLNCSLVWRANSSQTEVPDVVQRLAERAGVLRVSWMPHGQ